MLFRKFLLVPLSLAVMAGLFGVVEILSRAVFLAPLEEARIERVALIETWTDHYARWCTDPGPKPPGVRRLIVVGESSAEMLGEHMANMQLEGHEVINCGLSGASLGEVEEIFDRVIGFDPDEVVLVFGHNLTFADPPERWALRVDAVRAQSALLTFLTTQGGEAADADFCRGHQAQLARFERFLRRVVKRSRSDGAGVTFLTLATNRLWPPDGAPSSLALAETRFVEAQAGPHLALSLLKGADDRRTRADAWSMYELGMLKLRVGDVPGALDALDRAIEVPCSGNRATEDGVNASLRRIAKDEGVRLRDTSHVAAERADTGVVGWRAIQDNCHLQWDYFSTEAKAVMEMVGFVPSDYEPLPDGFERLVVLEALKVIAGAMTPDSVSRTSERALSSLVWRTSGTHDAVAVNRIATWVNDAPLDDVVRARVLSSVADGLRLAGYVDEALAVRRPIPQNTAAASVWIDHGLLLVQAGADKRKVEDAFKRAAELSERPERVREVAKYLRLAQSLGSGRRAPTPTVER